MAFRKDINGLRAIAVIAVVLFHFNPSWMTGGFAGVDVFFVISGFLMTGIIVRGIEKNDFSILKFYVARANRIIPALAALCLVLLLFGWFYLTPLDYRVLGKHVAGSIGFLSNVVYWRESGYFDAASLEKWLLHTWSLSVEWQFYIIYPIILLGIRKVFSAQAIKPAVLVLTIIGFALCVVATYKWPTAAYYLLPARVWEMTIGGVAYLYPIKANDRQRKMLETVGVVFIVGAYFLVSSETPWPGYLALFPVLGSFFIILAQRNNSLITGNFIFQKIGLWSYSIYLWHWPLVVAINYFEISKYWSYIGIAASVFLGFLSSKYIESIKFKYDFYSFLEVFKSLLFYIFCFVVFLGFLVYFSNGSNSNSFLIKYESRLAYPKICHVDGSNKKDQSDYINCKVGSSSEKPKVLIWGDSYAGVLDPFVERLLGNHSAISRTTSHCFPSLSIDSMLGGNPEYCSEVRRVNRKEVYDNVYDIVFLAGRWESMYEKYGEEGLNSVFETIDFASKNSKLVYVFEQPIYYKKNVSNQFLSRKIINNSSLLFVRDDEKVKNVNGMLKSFYNDSQYSNVYYVDRNVLYGSDYHGDYTEKGIPYTYDEGHLNISGVIAASENFKKTSLYNVFISVLEGSGSAGVE